MTNFSQNEIKRTKLIGYIWLGIAFLMYACGAFMLAKEIGTPEYVVSLRNAGVTLLIIGGLWTALAFLKGANHS